MVFPDSVSNLPASLLLHGKKTQQSIDFSPKYWIVKNLVKDGNAAKISGRSITSFRDLPWEELFRNSDTFCLLFKVNKKQRVPYCYEENIISVELSCDNEHIATQIANWFNGHISPKKKSTFIYASELKYALRFPISTGTYNPDGIFINSYPDNNKIFNTPDSLLRHCLIAGQTGSGKTNTAKIIMEDIINNNFSGNIFVLDIKGEYGSWAKKNDIPYYEVGKHPKLLKMLNINPFIPPLETRLITHIQMLSKILCVSSYSGAGIILPEYMKNVLFAFYSNLWNANVTQLNNLLNLTGKELLELGYPFYSKTNDTLPQLLSNFWNDYSQKGFNEFLGNSTGRSLSDLKGILSSRINSLSYSPLNFFSYNKNANSPDVLLNKSYVISLQGAEDHLILLSSLFSFLIAQAARMRKEFRHIKNILLIEEAHLIMARAPQSADVLTAEAILGNTFDRMLAELRSKGVGIILVDQSPGQLVRNVIANTGSKFIHRLSSPEEIVEMAETLGLPEDSDLPFLSTGEFYKKINNRFPQKGKLKKWNSSLSKITK